MTELNEQTQPPAPTEAEKPLRTFAELSNLDKVKAVINTAIFPISINTALEDAGIEVTDEEKKEIEAKIDNYVQLGIALNGQKKELTDADTTTIKSIIAGVDTIWSSDERRYWLIPISTRLQIEEEVRAAVGPDYGDLIRGRLNRMKEESAKALRLLEIEPESVFKWNANRGWDEFFSQ